MDAWINPMLPADEPSRPLAKAICRGEPLDGLASPDALADLLAHLLEQLKPSSAPILVFEDLHKVGGDVLRFIKAVRTRLKHLQSTALFVFTSRLEPEHTHSVAEWRSERAALIQEGDASNALIDAPLETEAFEILRAASPLLYQEFADAMIDRAGVSPFELTELVRFLGAKGVITPSGNAGFWRVQDAPALRNALRDPTLLQTSLTVRRLEILSQLMPDWIKDALDSAACLGREFDLDALLETLGLNAGHTEMDRELGRLTSEGIWQPIFRMGRQSWRFSHDLIHEAVLKRLCTSQNDARRLRLVQMLRQKWNDPSSDVELALSYLSGDGDGFVAVASRHSDQRAKAGYPFDASHSAMLEEFVLEQLSDRPAGGAWPQSDNPVYRVARCPKIRAIHSVTERDRRLIDVKRRRLEMIAQISGGAGDDLASLITDVTKLARRAGDLDALAFSHRQNGHYQIQAQNPKQARDAFIEARNAYNKLETSSDADRFEALMGYAIALRLLKDDRAGEALEEARRLAADRPERLIRYHANYGALFLYSDPALRREHWQRAHTIATEAGLVEKSMHHRLDVLSLDLIEGDYARVRKALPAALEEAQRRRFDGWVMKILIMEGCLDLIDGFPEKALRTFEEARRIGFENEAKRRIWRVHANIATTNEIMGDFEAMAEADRHLLKVSNVVGWEKRNALAPANIVMRAGAPDHAPVYRPLCDQLEHTARNAANLIVKAVRERRSLTGQFPQEHLRTINGVERFIMF